MATSAKRSRDAELAALREKKLTTQFNRYFSDAASAIAKERREAELAIQEIERRRAEAALKMANNPHQIDNRNSMTALDEMYLELKRREESVRRRERETLEKYRSYMHSASNTFAGDLSGAVPAGSATNRRTSFRSPASFRRSDAALVTPNANKNNAAAADATPRSSSYRRPDAVSGDAADEEVRRLDSLTKSGTVGKGVSRYEGESGVASPTSSRRPVDTVDENAPIGTPDAAATSTSSSPSVAKALTYDGAVSDVKSRPLENQSSQTTATTDAASGSFAADGGAAKDENTAVVAKEEDSDNSADDHWTLNIREGDDDDDSLTVLSYGASTIASTLDESVRNSGAPVVFVSEAEMKLTHFLQANKEAIAKLSSDIHSASPSVTSNITSPTTGRQVKKDYMEAVANAERAAKMMADAVAETTHAPTDDADKTKNRSGHHSGWYEYWSEEHQRSYYFEPSTNTVSWEAPDEYNDTTNVRGDDDGGPKTEEERLQCNMQNWSMDDFLPENHNQGKVATRPGGGGVKSADGKKKRRRKRRECADDRSVLSRSSRKSTSSRRSLRSNASSMSQLSRSILAPPKKKYSLWNERNRKRRKRLIRRTFWSLVLAVVACQAGKRLYQRYGPDHGVVVEDAVPVVEEVVSKRRKKKKKKEKQPVVPAVAPTKEKEEKQKAEEAAAAAAATNNDFTSISMLDHFVATSKPKKEEPPPSSPPPPVVDQVTEKNDDHNDSAMTVAERSERPNHCLVPLVSWLLPECRRQAQINPLFDLEALVDIMME